MTITADVAVVGAGPAGCAAAITLARGGRSVVLVDRARFPRDKCCGDGLTTGALRRLEALGLRPECVAHWQAVEDVVVRSPSGRTITFPLPRDQGTYAAIAPRLELDAALLDVARQAGVDVRDGHALIGAAVDSAGAAVRLDVDGLGPVSARYAIGADGVWSPLRKALSRSVRRTRGEMYLGEWHAFRQYFSDVGPRAADRIWVWFEPELLPGYAWSFPLPGGRANVGFGVARRPGVPTRSMNQQWLDLLVQPHVRAVLGPNATATDPHKAWPIPGDVAATPLHQAGGRALFVGDAARACDPMTGEGIAQALETGALAAEAILEAGALQPAYAATAYESNVRRGLAVDSALASFLSRRALAYPKGSRAAVRIAGLTPWTRHNFARWLFEDYPRAILATPWRWHRRMLTGPGAFR